MNRKITYGLASGSLVVAIYLAAYKSDPKFMLGPVVFWITFALTIAAMFLAAWQDKKAMGTIDFRTVIKVCFTVFIISNTFYYTFYYLIFSFDPNLALISKQLALESLEMVRDYSSHAPGASSVKEIEQQYLNQDYNVSIGNVLSLFAQGALAGFLISVILAFILKTPDKHEA